MQGRISRDKPRGAAAEPVPLYGRNRGRVDSGVVGESEIIVRGQKNDGSAIYRYTARTAQRIGFHVAERPEESVGLELPEGFLKKSVIHVGAITSIYRCFHGVNTPHFDFWSFLGYKCNFSIREIRMAYKIRVATRKNQLKKPDEFIGTLDRLGEMIREQATLVGSVLALLVVAGAAYGAYWFYQENQKNHAANLEFQGLEYYRQEVPPDPKTASPSKEEAYKKAVEEFQTVLKQYPGTSSAEIAQFYIGNANMELKDFDAAIAAYRALVEKKTKNDILLGMAYQRLGYAYLEKRESDEARTAFEAVGAVPGAINKDQADLELGRLYESTGEKEDAIKRYHEIVSQYPDSMFLAEAQGRLTALGVKDVQAKPPAGPATETPAENPAASAPARKPAQGAPSAPLEKK
jgi:TolA-binding protein